MASSLRRKRFLAVLLIRLAVRGVVPPPLGAVNRGHLHWQVSIDAQGTIYFGTDRPDGRGRDDIFRASLRADDTLAIAQSLIGEANSNAHESTPYVFPDGNVLVFSRSQGDGGFGGADLFLSVRDGAGAWGNPRNLGPAGASEVPRPRPESLVPPAVHSSQASSLSFRAPAPILPCSGSANRRAGVPGDPALGPKGDLLALKPLHLVGILLAPVPALAIGVLVMRGGGVPEGNWLPHLAAAVGGISVAGSALAWSRRAAPEYTFLRWVPYVALILLGATLLHPGTDGVHRWLSLGPVRIHGGALVLPPLLVALVDASWFASAIAALTALVLLFLQPDAAQAASFFAGWIVVAAARRAQHASAVMITSLMIAAACLLRPDPLDPVPYVEGIVGMAAAQGPVLGGASVVSLAVVPLALAAFLEPPIGIPLAVYTAGTMVAAWLGNNPVPFLGYGASPILGYYGAVALCGRPGRSEGASSPAAEVKSETGPWL